MQVKISDERLLHLGWALAPMAGVLRRDRGADWRHRHTDTRRRPRETRQRLE